MMPIMDRFKKVIPIIIKDESVISDKPDEWNSLNYNLKLCVEYNIPIINDYLSEVVSFILNSKHEILDMKNYSRFIVLPRDREYCFIGSLEFKDGHVLFILEEAIETKNKNCQLSLNGEYLFML